MFRRWTFRTLCIGVLAVFGLAICAVAFSILRDRQQSVDEGVRGIHNIAVVFGGQIERAIQSVDIVLQSLRYRIADLDVLIALGEYSLSPDQWRGLLSPSLQMVPQAVEIAVVGADGQLIASTAFVGVPDVNLSRTGWFRDIAAGPDDRLVAARSLPWQAPGDALLVLVRRLNAPDGSFHGVIYATVGRKYVEDSYARTVSLRDQTFSIVLSDGTTLMRYPDPVERAGMKFPASSPWYETVRRGGGTYRALGPFRGEPGGVYRHVAVFPLTSVSLVVNAGVPEENLLEGWRSRAAMTAAGTIVLLVCALALLAVMARQYRALSASRTALAAEAEALEREHGRLVGSEAELREKQIRLEQREAELEVQNQRFDAALNNMSHGLAMFDGDARLIVCNACFAAIFKLPHEFMRPGLLLRDILAHCHEHRGFPDDIDAVIADIERLVARGFGTYEFRDIDGHLFAASHRLMSGNGWIVTIEDITSRRANEEQIRRLAHNDLLTGIPNRSRFLEQIGVAQERLHSSGAPFTVMLLDLDRFKQVNDSLGHAAGDILLKETARRLQASLRAADQLARLGGDEFAVIQSPPRDFAGGENTALSMRENAIVLGQRIIDLISQPYDIEGNEVFVGVSIGVAVAPIDGTDPEELMKKADLALYRSKSEGRNICSLFSIDMAALADQRHRMEADLRAGLANGDFKLHFQPQIDMRSGSVCGMEALVRWNHPERGVVAPGEFISLAEDTGLISPLGDWIVHAACSEASRWPSDVKLAVNISPAQFRKSTLFDVILCALIESGLPAERLEIEITEQVLLEQEPDNLRILHQLKNLGISIALDDFGTGYSSLAYLTRFPFDKIKIDQSFTRGIMARTDCEAVICAVIGLGRTLDIVTVAEGVETEDQLVALRAAGVDHVQGYLFGRPMPATRIRFDMPFSPRLAAAMRRSA